MIFFQFNYETVGQSRPSNTLQDISYFQVKFLKIFSRFKWCSFRSVPPYGYLKTFCTILFREHSCFLLPPGLHNLNFGLQTIYHYISAWISQTPLTFISELIVSLIRILCIILSTGLLRTMKICALTFLVWKFSVENIDLIISWIIKFGLWRTSPPSPPPCMMTSWNGIIFCVTGLLWSFGVFFDLRLNKWFSKQSRRRWLETPSRLLCRHCNGCSPGFRTL